MGHGCREFAPFRSSWSELVAVDLRVQAIEWIEGTKNPVHDRSSTGIVPRFAIRFGVMNDSDAHFSYRATRTGRHHYGQRLGHDPSPMQPVEIGWTVGIDPDPPIGVDLFVDVPGMSGQTNPCSFAVPEKARGTEEGDLNFA